MFDFLRKTIAERGRNEQGAAAVIIAICLGLLIPPILALTVDVGTFRIATKDMQAVADVVALDLAKRIDGRTKHELKPAMDSALAASVNRNSDSPIGSNLEVTYELGVLNNDGSFVTTPLRPTAVKVRATTTINPIFQNSKPVTRTAIAASESSACVRIGTNVLGFNGNGSPLLRPILNGLLGVNTGITAVGYEGLANANLSLREIAVALGVGADELITTDVSLLRLVEASIDILTEQGEINADQIAVLELIEGSGSAALNSALSLGDILGLEVGNAAVLNSSLDVLSLIYGGLSVISPDGAIAVPGLNVGPLAATLHVGEPAKLVCTGSPGQSAAARVSLGANIPLGIGILGILDVSLKIDIKLAEATAAITGSGCQAPPGNTTGQILSHEVATITPDISIDALLGLIAVDINLAPGKANAIPPTFSVPNGPYSDRGLTAPKHLGSGDLSLNNISRANVNVVLLGSNLLSPLLSGVVTALLQLLNPIIDLVNVAVVDTIGPLLGLELNGLDVFGVEKPVCSLSTLKG